MTCPVCQTEMLRSDTPPNVVMSWGFKYLFGKLIDQWPMSKRTYRRPWRCRECSTALAPTKGDKP